MPLLAVAVAASCDFDRQRWRKVQAADSVPAYEAFLARNSRSPYVDSARARIAELRLRQAAAAFREATAQNTVSSYWNFAHRYRTFSIYGQFPNRHVKEAYAAYLDSAEARLDELEFREAEAANTFDSYWHFVFRRTKLRSAYLDSATARMLRAPTAPGYNVRGLAVHRCNGRPVIVEGYQRYAHVFERPASPGDTYGGRSFKSIGGASGCSSSHCRPASTSSSRVTSPEGSSSAARETRGCEWHGAGWPISGCRIRGARTSAWSRRWIETPRLEGRSLSGSRIATTPGTRC